MRWWIALVFLVSASAQAQGDATERYAAGVRALEAGDTASALEAFREAFEADASAEHALAYAATLQERGRLEDAIGLYGRLLAEEFGALPEGQAQAVLSARTQAREAQGTLTLEVREGPPVDVRIDGRSVGAVAPGATLVLRLDPGAHRLVARDGQGRDGAARSVELASGEARSLVLDQPTPVALPQPQEVADAYSGDDGAEPAQTAHPRRRRRRWLLAVAAIVLAGTVTGLVVWSQTRTRAEGFSEGPFPSVSAQTAF